MKERDQHEQARRDIMRRASLYTLVFLLAGLAIAVAGAALVAWLLTRRGYPFVTTWLILTAVIVLPGLTAAIWRLIKGR